jgi:kynurenine formamidase
MESTSCRHSQPGNLILDTRLGFGLCERFLPPSRRTNRDLPSNRNPDWRTRSFIHGGAWRDPGNTYKDFVPAINHMLASGACLKDKVKGFASINYRLSGSPGSDGRPVRHPDHIRDVRRALAFMQTAYTMESNYILMGHSVGATLAFQLLMGPDTAGPEAPEVPLPARAVGIAGIYEFRDFANRHGQFYIDFVTDALGPHQSTWNDAAPACFSGQYDASWPVAHRRAVLVFSPQDSLVDGAIETNNMARRLEREHVHCTVSELSGEHDVAWRDGREVAALMAAVLEEL